MSGRNKGDPRIPEARFEGTRLDAEGVVAVVFHARWCPFARAFGALFDEWAPPEGVDRRLGDISSDASPLWDDFDIPVTPTIALFKDGELVWRRDGVPMRGLTDRDLAALDTEARRVVGRE